MAQNRSKERWRAHPSIALLGALLLMALGIGTVSALDWGYTTIYPYEVLDGSMALDHDGHPGFAYYHWDNCLQYAYYDGSTWHYETVDHPVDGGAIDGMIGLYSSTAIDGMGYGHISYYDARNNPVNPTNDRYDLKYAWYDGSAWQNHVVDAAGDVGRWSSLVLDPATGHPWISYYDTTNGDLKYAAWTGTAWDIGTVDATGDVGRYPSLALDSAGRPRISYYDMTNGDLKYAAWTGTAWDIGAVDAAGDVGQYTSLALDSAGRPRVSYYDVTNGDLKYAAHDGAQWQIEVADADGDSVVTNSPGNIGRDSTLVLDGANNSHISYTGNAYLRYATADVPPCVIATAPAAGATGVSPATEISITFSEPIQFSESDANEKVRVTSDDGRWLAAYTHWRLSPPNTLTIGVSAGSDFLGKGILYTVTVDGVLDSAGNAMAAPCSWTFTTAGNLPPVVQPFTVPADPVAIGTTVSATTTFTDTGSAGPYTAIWMWGDGTTSIGSVTEGSVSGTHTYASAGVYQVTVTVTDDDNEAGMATSQNSLVVYDPNGGFLTGGGWIDSAAGAYVTDPALAGKASFGFVSKYQKGSTVPTGQTQFVFKAADFTFHSTSYDWLVIAGAKGPYKGSGTINGAGDYGFLLTAIDGQVTGGGGTDKFRLKVWDKASGTIIYNNQKGASDKADPTTVISGGSIVVHKK